MSRRIGSWTARPLASLFLALAFSLAAAPAARADAVTIFDARKSLPLDPSEPVHHDYYVSAGPEAGLKKGMYVSVVRKTPVHDPIGNKAQGTLSVEVAKVQIIHVERDLSVARLAAEFGAEDRPVLEFEAIMIGDVLDLATASMDAPKERKPGKKRGLSSQGSGNAAVSAPPAGSGAVPVEIAPSVPPAEPVPRKSVEKPTADGVPSPSPVTVESPSRPAPVPGMVPGDDDIRT